MNVCLISYSHISFKYKQWYLASIPSSTVLHASLVCLMIFTLLPNIVIAAQPDTDLVKKIKVNPLSTAPSISAPLQPLNQSSDPRLDRIKTWLQSQITSLQSGSRITQNIQQFQSRLSRLAKRPKPQTSLASRTDIEVKIHPLTGTPRQIRGRVLQQAMDNPRNTVKEFFKKYRQLIGARDPEREFKFLRMHEDRLGYKQLRYQQMHNGLRVWPVEINVQLDQNGNVNLMTGTYRRMPRKLITSPVFKANTARQQAIRAVPEGKYGKVSEPELIVYAPINGVIRLGWKFEVAVSLQSNWLVVIDAMNGNTLEAYNQVMNNNIIGSGTDLFGNIKSLNVWQDGNTFYMVDTSKPMFDTTSSPPSPNPQVTRGAIILQDAQNQDIQFVSQAQNVTSSSATSGWLNDAVSASFNL